MRAIFAPFLLFCSLASKRASAVTQVKGALKTAKWKLDESAVQQEAGQSEDGFPSGDCSFISGPILGPMHISKPVYPDQGWLRAFVYCSRANADVMVKKGLVRQQVRFSALKT